MLAIPHGKFQNMHLALSDKFYKMGDFKIKHFVKKF